MQPLELINSDPGFATICAQCRRECDPWESSINITPDAVFIGLGTVVEFHKAVVELDIAFDWCSPTCFGRWVFAAAAFMQSPERPPE